MHKVIFACVHNAGRSQMAAAFFNQLADRSKAEAVSAGTEPGLRVHPEVLAVMQEIGIDLSAATPQKLNPGACKRCGPAHHHGLWRQMPLCSRPSPR
jgi:protein-tyrosine-phosphatase